MRFIFHDTPRMSSDSKWEYTALVLGPTLAQTVKKESALQEDAARFGISIGRRAGSTFLRRWPCNRFGKLRRRSHIRSEARECRSQDLCAGSARIGEATHRSLVEIAELTTTAGSTKASAAGAGSWLTLTCMLD